MLSWAHSTGLATAGHWIDRIIEQPLNSDCSSDLPVGKRPQTKPVGHDLCDCRHRQRRRGAAPRRRLRSIDVPGDRRAKAVS